MAKAVLISIRPEWVEKIANKWKTIEVRKTKPYLETPFKCYIYCINTRPFLVWGDVFRGDWFTEFTHLSGYGRAEADKIWDVFNGHVVGEFVCDTYVTDKTFGHDTLFNAAACMSESDMVAYSAGTLLYGWHISKLQIYDTPKSLSEFKGMRKTEFGAEPMEIKRAPQSWCYVEELKPEVRTMNDYINTAERGEQAMIKDSGDRREYATGAVRDMAEGKGRCDLLPLDVADTLLGSPGVLHWISEFQATDNEGFLMRALRTFWEEYGWDVPTVLLEVSKYMEEGAKKYGERNWEKGLPVSCFIDSAVRHYLKLLRGDDDEPHDRAFCWNILCCLWTIRNKSEKGCECE